MRSFVLPTSTRGIALRLSDEDIEGLKDGALRARHRTPKPVPHARQRHIKLFDDSIKIVLAGGAHITAPAVINKVSALFTQKREPMNTINPIRELKAPPTLKGFAASHSLVSSGNTALNATETALLRRQINDFEALPLAATSAAELADRIESEERQSEVLKYKDISVSDDMAVTFGEVKYDVGQGAFKHLVRAIAPQGAYSYLSGVDSELRAHNLRALLQSDEKVKLRTRNAAGTGREIFAVTSEKYPDIYANNVLRSVSRNTPEDARAIYTYDPTTTQLSFKELLMKQVNPSLYKHSTEDVFQIGRQWGVRDDGSTSVTMNLLLFRQLCANMAMLASDGYVKRVRHRGEGGAVIKRIDTMFAQTGGLVEVFSQKWASARATQWHKTPSVDSAMTAYGMLINARKLTAIGDKDLFAAQLAAGWGEEPGGTVADLVNGVTRTTRTGTMSNSSKFGLDKLETEATALMSLPAKTWEKTRRI